MLTPATLIEAKDDLKSFAIDIPQILKMGILKSYDDTAIGTQNQTEKQYYFVHLSFQEHFAARHLLSLLAQSHYKSCIEPFWSTVQGEPIDLVGVKHIKLLTACVDEFIGQTTAPQSTPLLQSISKWLAFCASHNADALRNHIIQSLQQTNVLLNTTIIQNTFVKVLDSKDPREKRNVYNFIAELPITEPIPKLQYKILAALSDTDTDARAAACATLGNFGEKAATNEVIAALINATRNEDYYVRSKACEALGKLGEKAATDEVVAALINATRDKAYNVTWKAWKALRELGEKAVTNEMIAGLVNEHSGRIDYDHNMSLGKCLVGAMCSFGRMKQLNSGIVKELCSYIRKSTTIDLTAIPS
ncbi:unnamed protein product [Rotaria magnacalcarata]|uniref:Uncharacterized protein n=2 Tax=Rotaria magnacalcarata TaxID=392030 RepID=A0A816E9C5_9BILA|nr:unnamed protein product [Rotaria magnacalcarata]CAF3813179.1 unnamed protein product [Rotaria magnacalcarata]